MTTLVVIWQSGPNSAIDDVKELGRSTRKRLYELSREVLTDQPNPALIEDEQKIPSSSFMMRRAARPQEMRDLESLPDGDPSTPLTVDYWYIYRNLNPSERADHGGQGFFVARVVHTLQLAWCIEQVQTR